MFKYGSFRLFILKILAGLLLITFSIVYVVSLKTHNYNDKAFGITGSNFNIENYFGLFGSYLSSGSLNLIGSLSYLMFLFLALEGIKLTIGIKNPYLIPRFVLIFFGITLTNLFIAAYTASAFNAGTLAKQLYIFTLSLFNVYILNTAIIYLIYLFLFLIGLLLIYVSFSIKIKYLKSFIRPFRFLIYLKYLKLIFYIFRIFNKKTKYKNLSKKSEPTLTKGKFLGKQKNESFTKSNYKQLEIDQFKFSLPNNNLLLKSKKGGNNIKEINKNNESLSIKLEKTLAEYGVDGKIIGYKSGPIVTLFEFVPNAGIKSSKVISLADDIARAMSSISARISSQPGKSSLGIEIPNSKRENVLFGDLIENELFKNLGDRLTLALGKDISGEEVFADLEKMPHLLIAGTTGSGKSVGINTMILSILYRFKPNECKLILIDPKMLELSVYEDIPHLLTPVVTDPKKAVYALKWVVREMENRYKLMSSVNVKNIESYNIKVEKTISAGKKLFREVQTGINSDTRMPILEKIEITLEKLPFIVVVIDEMADLMMVAGKEVESLIQRLAQMARASGIHLITATQRPSVDVITGTIKANFPSRVSYKVASKFDSRTILNEMGAEQLLGSGDMLLLENGGNIKRLHGGYISEDEVEKVVASIKNQATFDYKKEISLENIEASQTTSGDLVSGNNDELYTKAVDIVVKQQRVSTSYIQRYLQIGYNRAARIIEKMEEDGIITQANNAGKRSVLKKS